MDYLPKPLCVCVCVCVCGGGGGGCRCVCVCVCVCGGGGGGGIRACVYMSSQREERKETFLALCGSTHLDDLRVFLVP